MKRVPGFYWVKFVDGKPEDAPTIGAYLRDYDPKDEDTSYPWEVVASDGIFKEHEIQVIAGPIALPKDDKYLERDRLQDAVNEGHCSLGESYDHS